MANHELQDTRQGIANASKNMQKGTRKDSISIRILQAMVPGILLKPECNLVIMWSLGPQTPISPLSLGRSDTSEIICLLFRFLALIVISSYAPPMKKTRISFCIGGMLLATPAKYD